MKESATSQSPRTERTHHKGPERESIIAEYVPILLRGKWAILTCFLGVTSLVALYTFTSSPVYESTARVLIDLEGRENLRAFSFGNAAAASANKVNNELEILQSKSMLGMVAGALLDRKTIDPGGKELITLIQKGSSGDSLNGLASEPEIMDRLESAISFMPVRETDIIKISARSRNPREAAVLANVYAESYLNRNTQASRNRSRSIREFLESQRESKRKALDDAESNLQSYMQGSGTVALDDETKKVVDQMAQLEASRDANSVEMSARKRTLDASKTELAGLEPAIARSIGESNDSYVRLLQDQLATLEVQRDVIVAQNPNLIGRKIYDDKLKELNEQITTLKAKLKDRTAEFLRSIGPSPGGETGSAGYLAQTRQRIIEQQIELEGLAARGKALDQVLSGYEQQFSRIPRKTIDLARYQRARVSSEKLYMLVDEKFNDALITEKSEFGYVDIIDPAIVSDKPVSPKKGLNLIVGMILGLMGGIAFVVLKERRAPRVRTPEDLKRFDFPSISTVARMDENDQTGTPESARPPGEKSLDRHLVTVHSPLSVYAESFRLLRTNVQFAQLDATLKSIMVTSANPSEGKSTSAANLAITFAQTDRKVLLVDADLRRPSLHKLFFTPRSPGLTDFIRTAATIEQVVRRNVVKNLDIVFSGTVVPNPAEVADSRAMGVFMKLMSQMYDLVIFDTSPILAVSDAAIFSRHVDGALLVVSSGNTFAPDVERAVEVLETVGTRMLGVILNYFEPLKAYGKNYGTYSRSHYSYTEYVRSGSGDNDGKQSTRKSRSPGMSQK